MRPMRFSRFPVFAFAAFAFAGFASAQTAASGAAAADDNKPAVEAIPAAEQEAMDAECAFIMALIDANMPDLAAPVIAKAREKWPVLSARLEVLEQQGHLRLGHFDEVKAVLDYYNELEAAGSKVRGNEISEEDIAEISEEESGGTE